MKPWTLTMEAWSVWRRVIADLHHFDEEQDPDPFKSDADPQPCEFFDDIISNS